MPPRPHLPSLCSVTPRAAWRQPGPLPTLTTCFLLHSTYIPVPRKIKVQQNKVSGGSGSLSPELRLICKVIEKAPSVPSCGGRESLGPWAGGGHGLHVVPLLERPALGKFLQGGNPRPAASPGRLSRMQMPKSTPSLLNQRPWVLRRPPGLLMRLQLKSQPRELLKARPHLCLPSSIFPSGPRYRAGQDLGEGQRAKDVTCPPHRSFARTFILRWGAQGQKGQATCLRTHS